MKVIASHPQFWHLLLDGTDYVFTVSCEHSFVGYDFTMRLNVSEADLYRQRGKAFLDELAEKINYSSPIARGSASPYKDRNIDSQVSEKLLAAIERWRAGGAPD